ncbi:ABC-F family ATP-binding cassette domain-containing protein [Clostridium perfringens]|uniref:ABC-F family ATP-binding cassette domain-containing protein n=1 Tax=Clostridium perfringens TaxID=1502 RepID=UPI000E53B922|nr:ABC-F family ATP-binding cassette domain-containing protein [Clostridium perfringens]MDK0592591.1 ABC-F family ATP-binding cassette domain-containing protein [Clostridium perfringens]MDK0595580.1 ABC-F family ATP-binding cassette domain-containing protein [Clostridium perfringens]MDK0689794.1 ABC-F family ATP-binding cassette domain-containing protein [Clostridium perfringens]MDM0786608.1 ABC-F family ATP-binding cassette domain-containing protein [Clostridium perfringens]RHN27912.1 ABC tra
MSILIVKNMNHGFGDRAIFEDVSFRLLKGEHVGLIGANGEGKSTFMNIITGKLMPDEGDVQWSNKVRVGYMDQHAKLEKGKTIREVLREAFQYLFDMEIEMNGLYERMGEMSEDEMTKALERTATIQDMLDHNGFYMIDAKVEEVAAGLGLRDVGLDKDVTDLSGGQRTKVLLAKLLLETPDILLLDEPTNYLDEEHIAWLKNYLIGYENAFILISHDIPFLNSVVNVIYHVENRALTRYTGDYDNFMRVYEANKKQLEAAYERQQAEIAKLEDFVARNKARVATTGMARARQKKLDKMDRIELAAEKPKPEFNFKQGRTSGKLIFEARDLVIGYDEPLSKPLNIRMERGQKIALVGANGLGKSTLLKSLMGLIKPISGEVETGDYQSIGYFEQEIKEANYNSCIEEVWQEFPGYTQYEVRSALAKCGLTTKHIESSVAVLSGGEQAKVRLCKLINKETNILILDEPTNHLDVEAKDELKRALKEYKGSILLVCHEPEFYRDVVTDVWNCEEWTTKIP